MGLPRLVGPPSLFAVTRTLILVHMLKFTELWKDIFLNLGHQASEKGK
jgi:hypothetical protein